MPAGSLALVIQSLAMGLVSQPILSPGGGDEGVVLEGLAKGAVR